MQNLSENEITNSSDYTLCCLRILTTGRRSNIVGKTIRRTLAIPFLHGHCEVTQNYNDNASLGVWVNKQQMEHKLR